jgi:hypothetical protein
MNRISTTIREINIPNLHLPGRAVIIARDWHLSKVPTGAFTEVIWQ